MRRKEGTVKTFNNLVHKGLSPQSCRRPSTRGLVEDLPTGSQRENLHAETNASCSRLIGDQDQLRVRRSCCSELGVWTGPVSQTEGKLSRMSLLQHPHTPPLPPPCGGDTISPRIGGLPRRSWVVWARVCVIGRG